MVLLGEIMRASCEKLAGKNLDRSLIDEMRIMVIQRLWPLRLRKEQTEGGDSDNVERTQSSSILADVGKSK